MPASRPSPSLRALVSRVVDYAGLFPPAALPMREAVARQAVYLQSGDAWMVGRLVVPASRLNELVEAAGSVDTIETPWRLSVLIDDATNDAARIREFSNAHGERFVVEAVEGRAESADEIERMVGAFEPGLERYVELTPHDDPRAQLESVRRAGGRAKIRTGGVTSGAFPSAAEIARFITRCAESGVAFKATAGLHHAVRGNYRLTYETNAANAPMFGFLNLLAASAMAAAGSSEVELIPLLEEHRGAAFAFDADGMRWRDHVVPIDRIAHARRTLAVAFGSCSFEEPRDELRELDLL
ncbi:MAG: hypothetical protein ABIV10_02210 [Gemmatimonadaceae bacterium]